SSNGTLNAVPHRDEHAPQPLSTTRNQVPRRLDERHSSTRNPVNHHRDSRRNTRPNLLSDLPQELEHSGENNSEVVLHQVQIRENQRIPHPANEAADQAKDRRHNVLPQPHNDRPKNVANEVVDPRHCRLERVLPQPDSESADSHERGLNILLPQPLNDREHRTLQEPDELLKRRLDHALPHLHRQIADRLEPRLDNRPQFLDNEVLHSRERANNPRHKRVAHERDDLLKDRLPRLSLTEEPHKRSNRGTDSEGNPRDSTNRRTDHRRQATSSGDSATDRANNGSDPRVQGTRSEARKNRDDVVADEVPQRKQRPLPQLNR